MTLKRLLISVLIAGLPAWAADPAASDAKVFSPFDVVSICPFATAGRSWAVAWHAAADGPNQKALRVFKYLQGDDVDSCLALMVEADLETYELVEAFAKNPTQELGKKATDAVHRRWTLYGVDRAITEVAESGSRGAEVARMLAACARIREPQIGGISDGGK